MARNRVICDDHPLHNKPDEEFRTRVELDIEGNQRKVYDERKLPDADNLPLGALQQRIVMQYAYDMLGNRIHQQSQEAGARWMLNDVAGKPIRAWDSRGHDFTTKYDALRRPIEQYVRGNFSDADPLKPNSDPRTLNPPNEAGLLVDKIEYGEPPLNPTHEQETEAQRLNLRTRIVRHFDSAGIATNARLDAAGNPTEAYDFKGNLLLSTRQLVSDYKAIPDWSRNPRPELDAETFEGRTRYDALNRPAQSIAPHSSLGRGKFSVIQPVFNEANLLERVHVWLERAAEPGKLLDPDVEAASPVGVTNVDYDARGQRLRIDYGNGASTFYTYDPLTFRLTQLLTKRKPADFPRDDPQPADPNWPGKQVQNLHYTYDLAGNITHIHDDAQQAVYFKNQRVEPSNDYVYDALYRLIQAQGREHLGQGGAPVPHSYNDAGCVGILSANPPGRFAPNDQSAMGRYTERYVYDAVGNFLLMQHARDDAAVPGWTRSYAYAQASLIEQGKQSNRLSRTTVGNAAPEPYRHDAHGNMLGMPQLQVMQWDYQDQLQLTQRQKVNDEDADGIMRRGERTWYVYDASGQRVRKLTERANTGANLGGIKDERIYLGGFEIFRSYQGPANARTLKLERETLHVMDDKQRIALVEMRTLGDEQGVAQRLIRYQFGNHLGSSSLELDEQAQIISYEEYAPYGSSTYQAVRSQTETAKRYRHTAKERDEDSGLYYHGARYYTAWLGRWTNCDPAGLLDGMNLYKAWRCSSVRYADPSGTMSKEAQAAWEAARHSETNMTPDQIGSVYQKPEDVPKQLVEPAKRSIGRVQEQQSRLAQGNAKEAQAKAAAAQTPKLTLSQKRELRTSAANAGAQNAVVESAESLADLGKVAALPALGPLVLTLPSVKLDWAKAPTPASTGDRLQDSILSDYYTTGGAAADATLLALSFVPVGEIAQGAKLAAGKLPVPANSLSSLGGSGFTSFSERWATAKPKTHITYIFTDAPGSIRYVGRASGTGSAEDVLYQRLTKGHHVFDANPELVADVLAEHPSKQASMGAESVYKDYFEQVGHKLLNDPKSPPLSTAGSKLEKTRERIRTFFASW